MVDNWTLIAYNRRKRIYMNITQKPILFALFMLLIVGGLNAATTEKDLSELTRIAGLQGQSYIAERDMFIQSRTEPVGMDKAIEKGWPEGLLALIINSRIDEPEWFRGWDNSRFGITRSGRPMWSPNPAPYNDPLNLKLSKYCNLLRMESMWRFYESNLSNREFMAQINAIPKGTWPKNVLDRYIGAYTRGRPLVPGPAELWRKVASETTNQRLMIIACNTLSADESQATERILKAKLQQAPIDVKRSLVCGLKGNKPGYAGSLVKDTYPSWKQDVGLAGQAFRIMARQPFDSEPRKFLKVIIMDPNQPLELRSRAIESTNKRSPEDFLFLKEFFDNSEHIELRREAINSLGYFPNGLAHGIMYKAIETETDPAILRSVIMHLKNIKGSSKHLEKFIQRKDITDDLKKEAEIAMEGLKDKKVKE